MDARKGKKERVGKTKQQRRERKNRGNGWKEASLRRGFLSVLERVLKDQKEEGSRDWGGESSGLLLKLEKRDVQCKVKWVENYKEKGGPAISWLPRGWDGRKGVWAHKKQYWSRGAARIEKET